jgi:hypothetical protein
MYRGQCYNFAISRQEETYLVTLEHVVEVLWIRTIVDLILLALVYRYNELWFPLCPL